MSLGKKTGGRDFKPGQAPKSPGRPSIPTALRDTKLLSAEWFCTVANELFNMTDREFRRCMQDPQTNMFTLLIGAQMQAAIRGRTSAFSFLLDRAIGPVKRYVTVEVPRTPSRELLSPEEHRAEMVRIRNWVLQDAERDGLCIILPTPLHHHV